MTGIVEALEKALGKDIFLSREDILLRHQPAAGLGSPRGEPPLALLRPKTTEEVSTILRLCHEAGQSVIPQGGMTGLVEATRSGGGEIAISTERMNKIESIDLQSRTMTVECGVPLQVIQEEAEKVGMLFPLDLGARGSCTIGGNVSTNAGGNRVIRYGMTRDQILGMEVVLPDGRVISSMSKIIKNNTGYDLKHLFIGAEGTLGIVTRLVLRLRPLPNSQDMAFVGVNSFKQVTDFLNYADRNLGGTLSAFEVLWKDYYNLVTTPPAEGKPPLAPDYHYFILMEAMGSDQAADNERFVNALGAALEEGIIDDAVIAQSQAERDAMWAIRDDVGQVMQHWPVSTFDVSVSLDQMESYVEELKVALADRWPDNTCMIFGHLGDGNLHIIVGVGDGSPETKAAIEETVYGGLVPRGGSVSAEHGIGLQKRKYLSMSRSEDEIAIMRMIKQAVDPKGILNPGKIFTL
ncbi:MAG: FAD-binding oxidoreductase [Gammaproteobacteria bacterium]|nr:FAD-binding oxidoreductase [Gammaproteobacteria bacterium]